MHATMLCSWNLNLMGNFNHPDICWKNNTVSCKQPSRLLESTDDSFLVQVLGRPNRGKVLPGLVLTNVRKLLKRQPQL